MADSNGAPSSPALVGQSGDSLRESFGKALTELAAGREDFVVLDADVAGGTGMHHFRRAYPDRFFQFGIAEQNMMAAAAGLATTGLIPVVTTFAVFCLRAYEQARLQIAYDRRNVKIVASHPGLDVGPDGASAQCLEDLAAFCALPNLTVISPADQTEMTQAAAAILDFVGPVYLRTGRSAAPRILPPDYRFAIGKARILRPGQDVALVACGPLVARALEAAAMLQQSGVAAMVVNCSTLKPLDEQTLVEAARTCGCLVTAEDHSVIGGLGSTVAHCLARHCPVPMEMVGVADVFGRSGEPEQLAAAYGIDAPAIVQAALKVVQRKGTNR